jgi:4'-phosphopantetheinyl transferase
MTQIYTYDIRRPMTEDEAAMIPPQRKTQAAKFSPVANKGRLHCLAVGLLESRYLNIRDESVLEYGEHGKPAFKDKHRYFNIAHSGDYVVLAVSDQEVGIDIEKLRPFPRAICKKCFREDEQAWALSQSVDKQDEALFRLWTGKESVGKAFGLGLAINAASFSLLPAVDGLHSIKNQDWFLTWTLLDGHIICLTSKSA